jgi:uncharacterized protein
MPVRSSYAQGTPNWVDLQTSDVSSAKSFYGGLFGWTFDDMPVPGGGAYSMAFVDGETVAALAPMNQPMIAGAAPPTWNTFIAVDDVDAAATKVGPAGGQLLMEPFDVTEAGRMAWVSDPGGAMFGLWQARNHIGATLVNEPNTLTWNELSSNDLETSLPFYESVLGVKVRTEPMGDVSYTLFVVGDNSVGGAAPPPMEGTPNHWHVWFAVADTDATATAATAGGGTVTMAPLDMPIGRVASLKDPQGAFFSVIAMTP